MEKSKGVLPLWSLYCVLVLNVICIAAIDRRLIMECLYYIRTPMAILSEKALLFRMGIIGFLILIETITAIVIIKRELNLGCYSAKYDSKSRNLVLLKEQI